MKRPLCLLLDFAFGRIKKPLLLICIAMAVAETVLVLLMANAQEAYLKPYEIILQTAWIPLVFAAAAGGLVAVLLTQIRCYYAKQKGIYTLLTLPAPPMTFVYAHVLTAAVSILCLIAVQILIVIALYAPAEAVANAYSASPAVMEQNNVQGVVRQSLHNGLFLTFVRSAFLHTLLPFGWQGILLLGSIVFAWSVLPVCVMFLRGGGLAVVSGTIALAAAGVATVYAFLVNTVSVTTVATEIDLISSNVLPIAGLFAVAIVFLLILRKRVLTASLLYGGAA